MNTHNIAITYLNKLGIKPKKSNNHMINISCPICNEGKSGKYKARGYVLLDNEVPIYNCMNECGAMSFYNFLDAQNHLLATQYKSEVSKNKLYNLKEVSKEEIKKVFKKDTSVDDKVSIFKEHIFDKAVYTKTVNGEQIDEEFELQELSNEAMCYLQNRGFKEEDYKDFKYCKETNDIIIPFWSNKKENKVYMTQSRNLIEKRFHNQNFLSNPKVSNLEYILNLPKESKVYVFESEFDRISSGIDESIGIIGAKMAQDVEELLKVYTLVYCLDADESGDYNSLAYAKKGHSVLIHREEMYQFKDFNKLLENDMTKETIKKYILENTQTPLKARMLLNLKGIR